MPPPSRLRVPNANRPAAMGVSLYLLHTCRCKPAPHDAPPTGVSEVRINPANLNKESEKKMAVERPTVPARKV